MQGSHWVIHNNVHILIETGETCSAVGSFMMVDVTEEAAIPSKNMNKLRFISALVRLS